MREGNKMFKYLSLLINDLILPTTNTTLLFFFLFLLVYVSVYIIVIDLFGVVFVCEKCFLSMIVYNIAAISVGQQYILRHCYKRILENIVCKNVLESFFCVFKIRVFYFGNILLGQITVITTDLEILSTAH